MDVKNLSGNIKVTVDKVCMIMATQLAKAGVCIMKHRALLGWTRLVRCRCLREACFIILAPGIVGFGREASQIEVLVLLT